jgi:LIM-domain binding protein
VSTNLSQSKGESQDFLYWHSFVEKFYAPNGSLRQGVYDAGKGSKQFEILTPALPRYYYTQFNSGIKHIQMIVEGAREKDMPNGGHYVECTKTSFIYWFVNDCQVCLSPFLSSFHLCSLGDTNPLL